MKELISLSRLAAGAGEGEPSPDLGCRCRNPSPLLPSASPLQGLIATIVTERGKHGTYACRVARFLPLPRGADLETNPALAHIGFDLIR